MFSTALRLIAIATTLAGFFPFRQTEAQQPHVYGNYGMLNYRGGGVPTGHFPKDFNAPAIDSLDELFKEHDQAYWAAELVGGEKAREFMCEGDRRLVDGLTRLLQVNITDWERKPPNAVKALTFATGALAFFRAKIRTICGR